MEKVMIGMSGGVDSSVAALLLKRSGYECLGATMHLLGGSGPDSGDAADAREVASRLGFGHVVLEAAREFDENVIRYFVRTYESGGTPNPCIECNRTMKFGRMFDFAREMGCGLLATGHYARCVRGDNGRLLLKKGLDESKDQSYFLYIMTQEMLSRTLFPLGDLSKEDVRRLAEENGLVTARKRDSQDICFVPDGDYASFICAYTGRDYPAGDFVDESGRVLGRHEGMIRYTVGQRRGLGVSGGKPLYVCRKCGEDNIILLTDDVHLYSDTLYGEKLNLIAIDRIEGSLRCKARIRYRHREQPATVTQVGEDRIRVVFDAPQRAVTAGQAVVLYDGDTVLGGAVIC